VVLVSVGLGLLARRAYRELRRRAPGPSLLFLCTVLASYLVVTPNLGFDSTHYYAPLVTLNMVLGGSALAAGLGLAWRTLAPLTTRRRRTSQNVQVPIA